MIVRTVDKVGTAWNFIFLGIVYAGVQHYTHHHCIAFSAAQHFYF
jgi:hypothetical protein